MKRKLSLILIVVFATSMTLAGLGMGCAPVEDPVVDEPLVDDPEIEDLQEAEIPDVDVEVPEVDEPDVDVADISIACYWPEPHPYYESVREGHAQFTEDYGIEIISQVGTDWSMTTQLEQVEAMMAQDFDAISLYPVDAAGSNVLFEDMAAMGIYGIGYGAQVELPTQAEFILATDVKAAAMAATEKVIKTMGEEGNILNILEFVEDPNTVLRDEGINEVVDQYPDVEIIQTIANLASIEEAYEQIESAIAGLGDDLHGMVTTGYNPTVGAAQVLSEMENDRIAYVGIDDDPVVLQAIEDGYVTGSFAQSPYYQGYVTNVLLMYLAKGYESKGFEFIDTAGIIVTQDNMDTFMDELWQQAFDDAENALDIWFQ